MYCPFKTPAVHSKLPLLPAPPAVLRGADQIQYLQHLLCLLPPCYCDTLLRLLGLLHTVQSYAQDSIGTNDEEASRLADLDKKDK